MAVLYTRRDLKDAFAKTERFNSISEEVPIVKGGLSEADIKRYVEKGWVLHEICVDLPDWPVTFGTGESGRTVVKVGTVPAGSQVLVNEATSEALLTG